MRFEFATASRIIFGMGTFKEVVPIATARGRRAFVITGKSLSRIQPLLEQLEKGGIQISIFSVSGEPDIHLITEGIQQARKAKAEIVISIGGGSVIDAGKAIAILLTNGGELLDFLEVIGRGKSFTQPSLPFIAIPTTSGTGAEVTRNAVLLVPEQKVKVSLRSPLMLPYLALVDPELTCSMPPELTATTGLDALTQLLEAFVSNKANPLTDGICREGLRIAGCSLQRAYENGNDFTARENMSLASLLSGLALANSGLGAVHGLAGPIGGMFPLSHGLICASLLVSVCRVNISALKRRAPDSPALSRYSEAARILTGINSANSEDLIYWLKEICIALKIPSLSRLGIPTDEFQTIIAKAINSSSMKGNPITLTEEELAEILLTAY